MSLRRIWGISLALSLLVLALTFYLQIFQHEAPCTLCIIERLSLMLASLIFLMAFIHYPKAWGRYVYLILLLISLGIGLFFAARHVYLQIEQPIIASCGPNLYVLFQMFPMNQALKIIFQGTSDCMQNHWMFLGLSLAQWSLINFIALIGLCLYSFKAKRA